MSDKLNKLHAAIAEVKPDHADKIVNKYQNVMESLNFALTDSKSKAAKQAQDQIEKITDDIITDQFTSERQYLVDSLDQELTTIEEYFGGNENLEVNGELEQAFGFVESFFKNLSIDLSSASYLESYLAFPEKDRIPPSRLLQVFKEFSYFLDSNLLKSKLYENKYTLTSILNLLCKGYVEKAENKISVLLNELDNLREMEKFSVELGIAEIDVSAIGNFFNLLDKENIPKDKIKLYVNTFKSNGQFQKLRKDLSVAELMVVLADMVVLMNQGPNSKNLVSANLDLKARIYGERTKLKKMLERHSKAAENLNAKLESTTDQKEIAKYKYQLSVVYKKLNDAQRDLILNGVKHAMVVKLLPKLKENKKVIDEIIYSNTAKGLADVIAKYKLPTNEELAKARLLEVNGMSLDSNVDSYSLVNEYSDVRALYFNMLRGYKPQGKEKEFAESHFSKQLEDQVKISNILLAEMKVEEDFFRSIYPKYKSIQEIPADAQGYTAGKVSNYILYLTKYYEVQGKILDLAGNLDLLEHVPAHVLEFSPMEFGKNNKIKQSQEVTEFTWGGKIKEIREEANEVKENLRDALTFVGSDNTVPDIDSISINPMQVEMLANEVSPVMDEFKTYLDPTLKHYSDLSKVQEGFQSGKEIRYKDFRQAFRTFEGCISAVGKSRNYLVKTQNELVAKRDQVPKELKNHPQLAKIRDEFYKTLILQVDWFLNDEKSPYSSKALASLENGLSNLKVAFDDFETKNILNIVAITAVIATSVFGGILIGGLVRAGAGLAMAGAVESGAIGANVAGFALGSAQLMGMSFGGVLFSRLGMMGTNAVGVSNYKVSWKAEDLSEDFILAFGMSLGIMGVARGIITSATRAANSTVPLLSNLGKGTLNKLTFLNKYTSPYRTWAAMKEKPAAATFVRVFGEEYAEELVETVGETVNPVLGFFLSVANSADGTNVDSSTARTKALEKIGVAKEAGKLVFKDSNARDFVADVKAKFGEEYFADLDVDYNLDGSVTFNSKGEKITVSPSNIGLAPDVEINRILGKLNLESDAQGNLDIRNTNNFAAFFASLDEQGFEYDYKDGKFLVKKLDFVREFKVDERVIQDFAKTYESMSANAEILSTVMDEVESTGTMSKGTWEKFVGAYQGLIASITLLAPNTAFASETELGVLDYLKNGYNWVLGSVLLAITSVIIFYGAKALGFVADKTTPIANLLMKNKFMKKKTQAIAKLRGIKGQHNGLGSNYYQKEIQTLPADVRTALDGKNITIEGIEFTATTYIQDLLDFVTSLQAQITTEFNRAPGLSPTAAKHLEEVNRLLTSAKSALDTILVEIRKPAGTRNIDLIVQNIQIVLTIRSELDALFNDQTPETYMDHVSEALKTMKPGQAFKGAATLAILFLILAQLKQCGIDGTGPGTSGGSDVPPVAPPTAPGGGGSGPVVAPPPAPSEGGGTVAPPPAPSGGGGTATPPVEGGGTPKPPAEAAEEEVLGN